MIPVTIAGVILIAKPPSLFGGHEYDKKTLIGVICSILSAIAAGSLYICLRKMGNNVHFTITALYYSIFGFVSVGAIIYTTSGFTLICQVDIFTSGKIFSWHGHSSLVIKDQVPYLLWLGVNGLVAMALLQSALAREKALRVGILNRFLVIFTYIFQITFTDDQGTG